MARFHTPSSLLVIFLALLCSLHRPESAAALRWRMREKSGERASEKCGETKIYLNSDEMVDDEIKGGEGRRGQREEGKPDQDPSDGSDPVTNMEHDASLTSCLTEKVTLSIVSLVARLRGAKELLVRSFSSGTDAYIDTASSLFLPLVLRVKIICVALQPH